MIKLGELFSVSYGHSLEFNRLERCGQSEGVAFVSRKMGDNGISGYVKQLEDVAPNPGGSLTCALSGNGVLSTFIQDSPYYTGFHVACLTPKIKLSQAQLLYYCTCIAANRYKYSWGRQANRTVREIVLPNLADIPQWVEKANIDLFTGAAKPQQMGVALALNTMGWKPFEFQVLFEIARGVGPRRNELDGSGTTPFITSSDSNNGRTGVTSMAPLHAANTIGVNRNGSVAEAFYHDVPFCSTEDVHIFTPRFELNPYIALFLTTLIRREKYRFGYGRKWGIQRMKISTIRLPVTATGEPDWVFMESYIKALPYSSRIQ